MLLPLPGWTDIIINSGISFSESPFRHGSAYSKIKSIKEAICHASCKRTHLPLSCWEKMHANDDGARGGVLLTANRASRESESLISSIKERHNDLCSRANSFSSSSFSLSFTCTKRAYGGCMQKSGRKYRSNKLVSTSVREDDEVISDNKLGKNINQLH